jgi:hypothetical protein
MEITVAACYYFDTMEQAMEHVCRIARIITNPSGNAMLIGVGGSGKL